MISVISCLRRPVAESIHERNVAKTVGVEFEYVPLDASARDYGLARGYNYGVNVSRGDILVFMHDDAYFMKGNWGQILQQKFAADPALGIVGVAGTQYLFADKYSWTAAGRPFIKGRVVHHLENGDFFAVVYSPENGDFEVVACDGVFFAIRRQLFESISFDEATFDRTSFYDIDFCMQARRLCRTVVTTDIVVKHQSPGTFDREWQAYGARFIEKWRGELPASCVAATPDFDRRVGSQCVTMKGKAPMETIC